MIVMGIDVNELLVSPSLCLSVSRSLFSLSLTSLSLSLSLSVSLWAAAIGGTSLRHLEVQACGFQHQGASSMPPVSKERGRVGERKEGREETDRV